MDMKVLELLPEKRRAVEVVDGPGMDRHEKSRST